MNKPAQVHGIFHRLSSVDTSRGVVRLISKYVAQDTKEDAISVSKAEATFTDEEYKKHLSRKRLPQRPGKDFVPSIHPTSVHAGGFITKFAPKYNLADPSQLELGLDAISAAWSHKTRDYATKAQHMVYSIRPDLQKRCLELGLPVQDILMAGAIRSLNQLNSWAHPSANLAYLLGFHSDKPNTHLHALIYPFDSKGKRINLSRLSKVKHEGRDIRVDYQGYTHRAYEDYLTEFAEVTHPLRRKTPEQKRQSIVRGALISMRDFSTAADVIQSGKEGDKAQIFVDCARDNAEDYKTADALRAEQSSQRKRYLSEIVPLKSDRAGIKATMLEMAADMKEATAALVAQADGIAKARENFDSSHRNRISSPFDYKFVRLGDGSLAVPAIITQAWADGLPVGSPITPLMRSKNPFLWEDGAKLISATRNQDSKDHAKVARASCDSVIGTNKVIEANITRAGYVCAAFNEIHSCIAGTTPKHLDIEITDEPTPPEVATPDKGLTDLRHTIMEQSNNLYMRHQPFDIRTDADKDFSPIDRRHSDDQGDGVENDAPIVNRESLLRRPTGIDPDAVIVAPNAEPSDLDIALDKAMAGFRPQGPRRSAGDVLADTPAMM